MIRVENLGFSYGSREVLRNVSFHAEKGELLAVLGPNGVGKSTLFRCILGILNGYSGTIRIKGKDIRELSRREMAKYISYIPQNHGTAFAYSVLDTVLMGTTHELGTFGSPKAAQVRQAMAALEQVGIADLADRVFNRLSGGEQQLAMIARALSQQAELLMMDEPTASLDYGNREKILALLSGLTKRGYSVVLSTHDPQHALSYSDRVLALYGGQVEAFGSTSEVLSAELLRKLYNIPAIIVDSPYGKLAAVDKNDSRRNITK